MPSRVFLDVAIGNREPGRLTFELFDDIAPRTCENFRGLCTGEYGTSTRLQKPLCYKGSRIFRVEAGGVVVGGDIECNNGKGGDSIYNGAFRDETYARRHTHAGVLSMAAPSRHKNTSVFQITLRRQPQLDGRAVVFGQLIGGIEVLRALEKVPCDSDKFPRVPIKIVDCGELKQVAPVRKSAPSVQAREALLSLMSSLGVAEEEATTVAPTRRKFAESAVATQVLADLRQDTTGPEASHNATELENALLELDDSQNPSDAAAVGNDVGVDADTGGQAKSPEARGDLDSRREKLLKLTQQLAKCRKSNAKEIAKEVKGDTRELKEVMGEMKDELPDELDSQLKKMTRKERENWIAKKQYLKETAAVIEKRHETGGRKRRNAENTFAWDILNVESHYRAHEKRTAGLAVDERAYLAQLVQLGPDKFFKPGDDVTAAFEVTEAARDCLANAVEEQLKKRKGYWRRRPFLEEETVQHINQSNRVFNQKIERAYGQYSAENRANLERGTAI